MNAQRKQPSLEERLRRIMLEGGFRSIRSLAEGCGLAPATLAKRIQRERETGTAKIEGQTIQRISKKTGFNPHWIMTGEGSPYGTAELEQESPAVGSSSSRDRVDWGREVVEGLVLQGVAPSRARQAVGALLLEGDAKFSSVVELYQASLERLGYAHVPVKKESSESRSQTRSRSKRSSRSSSK